MDTCKSPASTCASISQMLLALALSIMATNISAQTVEGETSDTALETLVVTAQRRAQNVQDVPASITALSSETLERMQITSINQLSSAAPNLQVTQEFGPGSPATFTIRGVSSANFGPNQSEPVAFYIDEGIRLLPQFEAMPMFDIEHVEVLSGPQGALYGKNATGGAVSVITKKPGFDTSGYISAGYGNFNRVDSEGAIQSAIVNEKLAFRVAYTYAHDDGAIKEVAPSSAPWLAGEDLEQTAYWALRASLLFRLSDKVDSLLRYNHYETKGRNTPSYQGTDIDYGAVGFPVFDSIPGAHRQGLGFFENQNDFIGHRRLINDGFNNQITWKVTPNITLLSLTTFDWGKWNEAIDGDGAPVNVTNNDRADTSNTNQFVQEFRLTGTTEKTNWVLGAFYGHDHVNVFQQYPYFEDPRCGAACDFGIGGGGIGEVTTNQFGQTRSSYAGYGRLEYALTQRFSVAGGLRGSYDEVKIYNYDAWLGDSNIALLIPTIVDVNRSRNSSNVSGELTATYKPGRQLLAYASFKQGYRTGAFNGQGFNSPLEVDYVKPETVNNWETGIKTNFLDHRATFNLTAFYMTYKNQQIINEEVSPQGFPVYPLIGIPAARIIGAESMLSVRPASNLTISLTAGYADGVYTRGEVSGENIVGDRMFSSARWTGVVGVDWTVAHFGDSVVNLHVDTAAQSRSYFTVPNTRTVSDSGHELTSLQLSYETPDWRFSLWSQNLFDSHYIVAGYNDLSSLGQNILNRGLPRTFGIRVRRAF